MNIALFGSTGFVGKRLVQSILDAGHEVKVLVRDPGKLGDFAGRVTVVSGDYFRGEDIDSTIAGTEAVVSTIGPSIGEMSADFSDNCVRSMKHLLQSLKHHGSRRLIFMSGAGMPVPGERLELTRRLMATTLALIAKKAWTGKVTEMAMALDADLEVTIIRPPRIRRQFAGEFRVDESSIGGFFVDVRQVAEFMVTQLTDTRWIGKAPVVWTKRSRQR